MHLPYAYPTITNKSNQINFMHLTHWPFRSQENSILDFHEIGKDILLGSQKGKETNLLITHQKSFSFLKTHQWVYQILHGLWHGGSCVRHGSGCERLEKNMGWEFEQVCCKRWVSWLLCFFLSVLFIYSCTFLSCWKREKEKDKEHQLPIRYCTARIRSVPWWFHEITILYKRRAQAQPNFLWIWNDLLGLFV